MSLTHEYVANGMALVAIPSRLKGPLSVGWNKQDSVITDPMVASSLTENVGLAHAYNPSGPTMALDIDDLPMAKDWLKERGIDLDAYFAADDGVQIVSGKQGRAKFLFRLPPGIKPIRTVQIKDPKTGDMVLEFRCASANGLTVQDVLPPSIHPETRAPYEWGGKGDWRNIPTIPSDLLKVWQDQLGSPSPSGPGPSTIMTKPVIEVDAQTIQHLRSATLSMRSDDHSLWVKVGMALKELGEVGRGIWMEWSLTSPKSLDGNGPLDVAKTWDGFKPTQIGYKFVFAEAQRRGWVNPMTTFPPAPGETVVIGDWGAPKPLPNALRTVKALDPKLLPSTIRSAASDIAERLSCPIDYVAVSILVGAGAIIGNRIGILPKQYDESWEVYPVLWGGIVGPPGSMKTPVQLETMKPLRHLEEQENLQYASALSQYQVAKKRYERDLADFKSGKTKELPPEPAEPKKPRLVVNDVTYQALGVILDANPRGVLIHGDELSGLLQSLDAPGQEAARGFYLTGWGGSGNYTFDRIGRGSIRLKNYALSLFGGFQPDKIKHYVRGAQSGSSQNDGLLQRFQLIVWPDLDTDFNLVDRAPNKAALERLNRAMLNLRDAHPHASKNLVGARLLHFDEDAQAIFNNWYVQNEQLLRNGTLGLSEQSHLAKYRSLIPALALLFHLLDAHEGEVCSSCLNRAIQFALYLKSHAMRLYGAVNREDFASAQALATAIKSGKLRSGFSLFDLYSKGWRDLSDQTSAKNAVDNLLELGWLKEKSAETGGRPKIIYEINPACMN